MNGQRGERHSSLLFLPGVLNSLPMAPTCLSLSIVPGHRFRGHRHWALVPCEPRSLCASVRSRPISFPRVGRVVRLCRSRSYFPHYGQLPQHGTCVIILASSLLFFVFGDGWRRLLSIDGFPFTSRLNSGGCIRSCCCALG